MEWNVLCVDDDPRMAEQVRDFLTNWRIDNPFGTLRVETETSFSRAKERLKRERFDFVTLDLHEEQDPDPNGGDVAIESQTGEKILESIQQTRFLPVIFYTGFAAKIGGLASPAVKVVSKGDNDLASIRAAATEIYKTGLPKLVRHIEEEQRKYLWETVSGEWDKVKTEVLEENLAYLLAKRLSHALSRESVKTLLGHDAERARPLEHYIYPPTSQQIRTGCIFGPEKDGAHWIVVTPECDFAQRKADNVLVARAELLENLAEFKAWEAEKNGNAGGLAKKKEDLVRILKNSKPRFWFLPGTFFLPSCVVDFQTTRHIAKADFDKTDMICSLDSPYRQEFVLAFSRYYGRLGKPDLDVESVLV